MKSSGDILISETTSFNDGWNFQKEKGDWVSVDLPHTPKLEPLIVNDQWQGRSSYTKTFEVEENRKGKTLLHFEGVMHEAKVFINELEIKEHFGGYLPFSVDLTDHLISGQNTLRVEVLNTDNPNVPPGKALAGLDFNYYGGIYRDVWLTRKNSIYITDPFLENNKEAGWLIHFDHVSDDQATGFLRIEVKNESKSKQELTVKVDLKNGDQVHSFQATLSLGSLGNQLAVIPIEIEDPALWSLTTPNLYQVSIEVIGDNITYDLIRDKIGIRKIELNDDGFFLNGKQQFIRGTNRHQEYPYVGYAISNNANKRDAVKIKKAGFDFVRLSHYPQDESFLDACDELGILVMNAIPGWQYFGDSTFVENSYQDIRDMVRRDRNHPSVVFWEVSLNESAMTDTYMEKANQILKEELPFKDTYSAGWIDHSSYDLFIPARQHAKPPHYWNNYKDGSRKIFIGEYGDWEYYAHNAGLNQTTFADLSEDARNSRQLRAHGEQRLLQQALNFQEATNSNRKGLGTIGHANWLMFDYNRGYADDLEASGISDIFRIPKFAYYFYQSQRPPFDTLYAENTVGPMVKIATYWTGNSDPNIRIYSNCEEIELYADGKLVERKTAPRNILSNKLKYPPFLFGLDGYRGKKLRAVGYINDVEVADDLVKTPGNGTDIKVEIDLSDVALSENESDLIFVYAKIVDEYGALVNTSEAEIAFSISAGELVGSNPVKAEAGIATILLKTENNKGEIEVIATGEGLNSEPVKPKYY